MYDHAMDALDDALDRKDEILNYRFPETATPIDDDAEPSRDPREQEKENN